jgi:hypothetical protein
MLPLRHNGVRGLSRWASAASSSPCIIHRELAYGQRALSVSAVCSKKQDHSYENEEKTNVQKHKPQPKARRQSLARVSMDAQVSRQIIQHKGGFRIIDPDLETKVHDKISMEQIIC